jgi:hypothetical protein
MGVVVSGLLLYRMGSVPVNAAEMGVKDQPEMVRFEHPVRQIAIPIAPEVSQDG